mgnify:CR=1 FL=1
METKFNLRKCEPCSPENFVERYTGDMIRDYEMLTPDEWLSIYGDEPDGI